MSQVNTGTDGQPGMDQPFGVSPLGNHQPAGQVSDQAGGQPTEGRASAAAGEAAQQTRRLADDARSQIQSVASETRAEVRRQAEERTSQAARGLRSLAEQAQALAGGSSQESQLKGMVDRLGRTASDAAERLDQRGLDGVLDELTRFGRRNPLPFLGLALAAGAVSGRALRAGMGAVSEQPSDPRRTGATTLNPAALAAASQTGSETGPGAPTPLQSPEATSGMPPAMPASSPSGVRP
jgi:hypothetical protein